MQPRHVVSLLAAASIAAFAAEHELVLPSGGHLSVKAAEGETATQTGFFGRLAVNGTLVAQWERMDPESPDESLAVYVILKPESVKLVPHFEGYPVSAIAIDNKDEALRQTIGARLLGRIQSKKVSRIQLDGWFEIADLAIGIECDVAFAHATLAIVRRHTTPVVAAAHSDSGCGR